MYQIGVALQECVSGGLVPPAVCWWVYLCHRRFSKPEGLATFPRAPPRHWGPASTYPCTVGGEQCGGASQQVHAGAGVGV